MRVLNVGGGTDRSPPAVYAGWDHLVLDIDPGVKPDICCDAKEMRKLEAGQFDAVYCSHNLEHFYRHEVPVVLAGFQHVLTAGGFAQIAVPDLQALMQAVVTGSRDVDAVWYQSPAGPIRFHDVLYGHGRVMAGGNLFYAHKCGFTERSLTKELTSAGFPHVYTATDGYSVHAYAFKAKPARKLRDMLCL